MNDSKLEKLFRLARGEPAPVAGPDFVSSIMRALRQNPVQTPPSLLDQLRELFPKLAVAAVLLIGLCMAAEICLSTLQNSDLTIGIAQLSEQWLFAMKGL